MVCEDALKGAFNKSFTECFGQRSRVFDVLERLFLQGFFRRVPFLCTCSTKVLLVLTDIHV